MKIEKKYHDQLIQNFENYRKNIDALMSGSITELKKAKSVEEIMARKRQLLISLISLLPMSSSYCYFCLKYPNCSLCEYGKIHGICDTDTFISGATTLKKRKKLPTWVKIRRMCLRLRNLIEDEYYQDGESFDGK